MPNESVRSVISTYVKIALYISWAAILGVVLHTWILIVSEKASLPELWIDFTDRAKRIHPEDTIPPRFIQRGVNYNGVAALSYLLTRIGEIVYQTDLYPKGVQWTSNLTPQQLIQVAAAKGYQLYLHRPTFDNLMDKPPLPSIAVLNGDRYVVLHGATSNVVFFDPATGRIHTVKSEKFLSVWSGTTLNLLLEQLP